VRVEVEDFIPRPFALAQALNKARQRRHMRGVCFESTDTSLSVCAAANANTEAIAQHKPIIKNYFQHKIPAI
jgi:hypothetical protein